MKIKFHLIVLPITLALAGCSVGKGVGPEASVPTVAPSSGPKEGIKIHGHWIIEVRNPDGTLVTRREFDNALTAAGSIILAASLARSNSPGEWVVSLAGNPQASSPCGTGGALIPCVVAEPSSRLAGTQVFKNLTVGRSGDSRRLILAGNATAERNGNVGIVGTSVQLCSGVGSACIGTTVGGTQFTSRSLAPTIAVQVGQQIQVTVEISFA